MTTRKDSAELATVELRVRALRRVAADTAAYNSLGDSVADAIRAAYRVGCTVDQIAQAAGLPAVLVGGYLQT